MGLPSCSGVEEQEVVSPDRHLVVGMTELDKGEYGDVSFAVYYNGERALPLVRLGMETNRQKYASNLKFKSVSEAKPITDDYRMLTGKRSHCVNHGTERVYSFENEDGNILDVTIRAYDDGVAFISGGDMEALSCVMPTVPTFTVCVCSTSSSPWERLGSRLGGCLS